MRRRTQRLAGPRVPYDAVLARRSLHVVQIAAVTQAADATRRYPPS